MVSPLIDPDNEDFPADLYVPCESAPDLWFSTSRQVLSEARKICKQQCLVRLACLERALEFEDTPYPRRWGVWGGMFPGERARLARLRNGDNPVSIEVPLEDEEESMYA